MTGPSIECTKSVLVLDQIQYVRRDCVPVSADEMERIAILVDDVASLGRQWQY